MWIFEGKKIMSLEDIPKEFRDSYGFIYNITTAEGKEYLGKKIYFTKTIE